MSSENRTTSPKLPGRPTAAGDIASARRWVDRVLKKIDMDYSTETNLRTAVASLRFLEERVLQDAR